MTTRTVKVSRSPDEVQLESLYPIPSPAELSGGALTESTALNDLAERLIEKHSLYAGECKIVLRWKDKGGASKGRPVLARLTKTSDWTFHLSDGANFLLWLAADNLREIGATNRIVEACLFGQLIRIGPTEEPDPCPKNWVPEPTILPYDFQGHTPELLAYGPWREELAAAVHVVRQMKFEEVG